jgi:hypothetical protein
MKHGTFFVLLIGYVGGAIVGTASPFRTSGDFIGSLGISMLIMFIGGWLSGIADRTAK